MLRRAFTLIELLLVIGIIALLAGILLPSLGGARRTAARTVGMANLRSMGQLHAVHLTDHRGEFYNPVFEGAKQGFGYAVPKLEPNEFISTPWGNHTRFITEGFMAYWYSYMAYMNPNSGLPAEPGVSPGDGEAVASMRRAGGDDRYLAPNSFYYSPTFWKATALYDFHHLDCRCCCNEYDPNRYRPDFCPPPKDPLAIIASNNVADVTYPSSKVLLWERGDFSQPSRAYVSGQTGGTQAKSPAWNNPRARVYVCAVDGSVSQANMQDLTARAARSRAEDRRLELLPVDLFEARDAMPVVPVCGALIADLPIASDGLYPYFFAATRFGIKGRDLP